MGAPTRNVSNIQTLVTIRNSSIFFAPPCGLIKTGPRESGDGAELGLTNGVAKLAGQRLRQRALGRERRRAQTRGLTVAGKMRRRAWSCPAINEMVYYC